MPAGLHDELKNVADGLLPDSKLAADQKLEAAFKSDVKNPYKWLGTSFQFYLLVPAAAILLEIVFTLAGIGQGEIVKPDLQLGCRHIANKVVTWRLEGYSHGRLNSDGMRDVEHSLSKPPGIKRIAFLGDSYTEGLQVPLEDTFARQMQNSLQSAASNVKNGSQSPYETLNFGCSSYSTGQEFLQFNQQVADYKPDLVVLLYTPGDSLENSVSPKDRAKAEARPYFYLDDAGQLQQDNGLLTLNYDKLRYRTLREFLRAHSTIYGAYNQINLSLSMSDKVYFRTTRLVSQIFARALALLPDKHDAKIPQGLTPPTAQEPDKIAVSQAIIKKLGEEIRARGGRLVVMTYPDLSGADPLYSQARSSFKILAQKQGFGFLDLTEAFSRVQNPNKLFIQVHFSKEGHDLTARALTTYLKSSGIFPE